MTNIFQVSHILQFLLRAFSVILLNSYMTKFLFSTELSRFQVQYSECNIKSAAWQMLQFSANQIADIFTCSR